MHRQPILLVILAALAFPQRAPAGGHSSDGLTAGSDQFVVRSYRGGPSASALLATCEELRTRLQSFWMGQASQAQWRPRCEVVLHASRTSYQQAAGPGSGQTFGSSLIQFQHGRVSLRRIDLLTRSDGQATALAHELGHVVLADRFGRQPPRWVDEGAATLADSWEKRRLHHRDCQYALSAGAAFPLKTLLTLKTCTSSDQVAAFYGQSLSLVQYLIDQGEPEQLLSMVELAFEKGYDHSLQETYGVTDVTDLERRWREFAMAPPGPGDALQFTALNRSAK
jgi:hypothetical protein